jgi:hypothetical protein
MGLYITIAVWVILAIRLITNFWDIMDEIGVLAQLVLMLVLTIGAPFFFIVELLELVIDLILPEGWDSD